MRRGVLEDVVIEALQHHLLAPEPVEEFVAAFHMEVNTALADQGAERAAAERRSDAVLRQIDGLVSAIAVGMRAPSFAARLTGLARMLEIARMVEIARRRAVSGNRRPDKKKPPG